jgi:hypothetical protein
MFCHIRMLLVLTVPLSLVAQTGLAQEPHIRVKHRRKPLVVKQGKKAGKRVRAPRRKLETTRAKGNGTKALTRDARGYYFYWLSRQRSASAAKAKEASKAAVDTAHATATKAANRAAKMSKATKARHKRMAKGKRKQPRLGSIARRLLDDEQPAANKDRANANGGSRGEESGTKASEKQGKSREDLLPRRRSKEPRVDSQEQLKRKPIEKQFLEGASAESAREK